MFTDCLFDCLSADCVWVGAFPAVAADWVAAGVRLVVVLQIGLRLGFDLWMMSTLQRLSGL